MNKIWIYLFFPISVLIALIWSLVARIRNFLYDKKIFKSTDFQTPYIIVLGNLAVGGTGKTPMTEYLINLLKNDFQIAVLSRGYGRKTKGFREVKIDNNFEQVGDEPLQIKNKFPNIRVFVGEDRVSAIKKIKQIFNPQIIILDDAFQHRKLKPHLSILLSTCSRPFFKDKFLPIGFLRDNKNQYKRADILIFTKCQNLQANEKDLFLNQLDFAEEKIFFTKIFYQKLYNVNTGQNIDFEQIKNKKILLITAIANAEPIKEFLKKHTQKIYHLEFSDHFRFDDKTVKKIEKKFAQIKQEKLIITTEKDYIKLKNIKSFKNLQQNTYVLQIKVEFLFNLHKLFNQQIYSYVRNNKTNS